MAWAWKELQRVALIQVKDPVLGHAENHKVETDPLLKPDKIPLCGLFSLKYISYTKQFCVICKFTEGEVNPTIHCP